MARHLIPATDGAPHAPTTECGCGPQRVLRGGRYVYVHQDQTATAAPASTGERRRRA